MIVTDIHPYLIIYFWYALLTLSSLCTTNSKIFWIKLLSDSKVKMKNYQKTNFPFKQKQKLKLIVSILT